MEEVAELVGEGLVIALMRKVRRPFDDRVFLRQDIEQIHHRKQSEDERADGWLTGGVTRAVDLGADLADLRGEIPLLLLDPLESGGELLQTGC